ARMVQQAPGEMRGRLTGGAHDLRGLGAGQRAKLITQLVAQPGLLGPGTEPGFDRSPVRGEREAGGTEPRGQLGERGQASEQRQLPSSATAENSALKAWNLPSSSRNCSSDNEAPVILSNRARKSARVVPGVMRKWRPLRDWEMRMNSARPLIEPASRGSAMITRNSRSVRESSSRAAACRPENPRKKYWRVALRSAISTRLNAGSGSVVASKTSVGKNSLLRERYSALSSSSARLLSSITGVTSARCDALAVMRVCPKPTTAE